MARARTVLSPPLPPRVTKAKPEVPEGPRYPVRPGVRYRCRVLSRNPWGEYERPTYSDDLAEQCAIRDRLAAEGIAAVVEEIHGPVYSRVWDA